MGGAACKIPETTENTQCPACSFSSRRDQATDEGFQSCLTDAEPEIPECPEDSAEDYQHCLTCEYVSLIPNKYMITCGPFEQVASSSFEIRNILERPVLFRVSAVIPKRYRIRPREGYLRVDENKCITVDFLCTDITDPRDYPIPHWLLVQSVPTTVCYDSKIETSQVWKGLSNIKHNYLYIHFIPDIDQELDRITEENKTIIWQLKSFERLSRVFKFTLLITVATAALWDII